MYSNTKHIHTHTHTHTKLNLGNVFYARKMAPSSQGSVSIYLIKIPFKSQPSVLKIVYEEAAEDQTWERQWEHHSPPAGTLLFFRETMWGSEEEAEQAPPFSPWLWESEVSCRFHSTLGQIRNHSPVCKPPVLQGVGNLEQETSHSHTDVTEPHTRLTRMGDGKAPEQGDGPSSSGLHQAPHPRWPQVRGGRLTF